MFMDKLSNVLLENYNTSITENGAIGYRTSGKNLLDINFSVSSMRNMSEQQIIDKFVKAFYEDRLLAVKWLFFARDARGGIGERRLFRVCMKYLAKNYAHAEIVKAVAELIPEYGRFDDWLCLLDTEVEEHVMNLMQVQLKQDLSDMEEGRPISLLAKWLPSVNTSSEETKRMARKIVRHMGMTEGTYRKTLSKLRAYLDVIEVAMSKGHWEEIEYSHVPSRANLLYNSAFLRNDEARRREYLGKLERGEAKIHADVLFPHDVVHSYYTGTSYYWSRKLKEKDIALEALWKALPDYVQGQGNTICVSDGSGSMTVNVGKTNISALEVALSLSIYFAERSAGQFKDKFITFSRRPQLVDLQKGQCLHDKLEIASKYTEVANTDIEKVFYLILDTAVQYKMTQEQMPATILILSDMEFDGCAENCNEKIFKVIAKKYSEHGYQLPRLVFWNINSRTGTIPVRENALGVALVSGFSPAIVKMVLSNKTDPFECLLEQLQAERYDAVETALKGVIKSI